MLTLLALDIDRPEGLPAHDDPGVDVVRRAMPVDEGERAALVADVAALAEHGQPILLLYPAAAQAETTIRLVRAATGCDTVAAVATTLPPLAAGILVTLLEGLAGRLALDAGRAVALVGELERVLHVVCWVRRLPPTVRRGRPRRQRWLAWSAVRGFDLTLGPAPDARKVPLGDRGPGVTLRHDSFARAAALRGRPRHVARLRHGAVSAGVPPVDTGSDPGASRRWFGTARAGEMVVYPTDLHELGLSLARHEPLVACAWCGLPGPDGPCSFCGHQRPPVLDRPIRDGRRGQGRDR